MYEEWVNMLAVILFWNVVQKICMMEPKLGEVTKIKKKRRRTDGIGKDIDDGLPSPNIDSLI